MNSKIIGYRQWDEGKKVEYVFCRECAETDETVTKDNPIVVEDGDEKLYFCDQCEKTLWQYHLLSWPILDLAESKD